MPSISMNPRANYVTQSRAFSGNIVGRPLTDRRIAYYAARGRYGPEYKEQQKARMVKKKRSTLASLEKEFG